MPRPCVVKGDGGPDRTFFLAFRKYHALRILTDGLEDQLQCGRGWVEARLELLAIRHQIFDWSAGDATINGRLGYSRRYLSNQPRVKWHRNNILGPIL